MTALQKNNSLNTAVSQVLAFTNYAYFLANHRDPNQQKTMPILNH